jgi:chromosome partitioning protein
MARANISTRLVVAALLVCGASAAAEQSAAAQRSEPSGDRMQPPTELLEEYPFRQGRLRSRDGPSGRRADAGSAELPVRGPATEGGDGAWPVIWLVFGVLTALLVLGLIGRRVARTNAGGHGQIPEPDPRLASPPVVLRPAPRLRAGRFARGRAVRRPENSYAVVNQKGGVGKTTVSLTLGAAAVRRGSRVLLLDLDPQASATSVLGADVHDGPTMTDVMLPQVDCTLGDAVRPTGWGLDLAPADRLLRAADTPIAISDEDVLPRQLETVGGYDLMLFDCPPSLGTLTINALTAASRALVVTEPTFLALHAIEELLDTLRVVAVSQNPSLELAGVVLNRVETTAEHKRSVAELEDTFGLQVIDPHVPKRAILQDAMRRGVPPQDLQSHSHYAIEIADIFNALAVRLEQIQLKS